MKPEENFTLVNLEATLADDKKGILKKEIIDKLLGEKATIVAKLNKGLTPEEFGPLDSFKNGLDAAINIVERYWAKKHRS